MNATVSSIIFYRIQNGRSWPEYRGPNAWRSFRRCVVGQLQTVPLPEIPPRFQAVVVPGTSLSSRTDDVAVVHWNRIRKEERWSFRQRDEFWGLSYVQG